MVTAASGTIAIAVAKNDRGMKSDLKRVGLVVFKKTTPVPRGGKKQVSVTAFSSI
jgi:hypothetical protein